MIGTRTVNPLHHTATGGIVTTATLTAGRHRTVIA